MEATQEPPSQLPPAQTDPPPPPPPTIPSGTAFHELLTTNAPPPVFPPGLGLGEGSPEQMPPGTQNPSQEQVPSDTRNRNPESDDGSGSGSDNEDSEDDDEHESPWYELPEDKTEAVGDELAFIESKQEYSALDHAHWEQKTFETIEMDDPEFIPVDSGRIDWLVEHYNGTKEKPNTERIMRSPVVRVGGYDWQIKFFPKGDRSEYLSVYLECVNMASQDFQEYEDFKDPPFPFLAGVEKVSKRRSVAVQFSIIIYNPDEPRVWEFEQEQHQFCKQAFNHGWRHFSNKSRYDISHRHTHRRAPLLRNDKLAFKAFIRVVNDPTGCLWVHDLPTADQMTSITGLRPFTKSLQYIAVAVPLLHFAPFRSLVQDLRPHSDSHLSKWLHTILLKMYTRKRSPNYGAPGGGEDGDVMEMLWRMNLCFEKEYPETPHLVKDLIGTFHAEKGGACGTSRLNTKDHKSIQAAIDKHHKVIARPQLLTLELQRQEHDKTDRKWKKLTHKVKVDEKITVGGASYTLYAFITHKGHLQSMQYNSYVRPKGVGNGWYGYRDSVVQRLTERQARDIHSGVEDSDKRPRTPEYGYDSPLTTFHNEIHEVTCAVMYVRDDVAQDAFNAPDVGSWIPPQVAQHNAPLNTSVHEEFQGSTLPVIGQTGQQVLSEEEYIRQCTLRERLEEAATAATPDPVLMDGEDVVMKDADDDSAFSPDGQEPTPHMEDNLEVGTLDWLGRAYYEGHWKDKVYHGGGHLIDLNGDEYIGQFEKGQKSGYGKMIYAATGDVYEGEWKDNQRDGQGKYVEHSSNNVYNGGWKEDIRHGEFNYSGTFTEDEKGQCSICLYQPMSTAFYDCGHVVACRECAEKVDTCPVCRRRVVARLQLWGVRISQC